MDRDKLIADFYARFCNEKSLSTWDDASFRESAARQARKAIFLADVLIAEELASRGGAIGDGGDDGAANKVPDGR